MEDNLEIEYKLLLHAEEFMALTQMYDEKAYVYTQVNYYFTSPALALKRYALRIREKEHHFEMTVKTPAKIGRHEYNLDLSESEAKEMISGHILSNKLTEKLAEDGIILEEIKPLTTLKTIRHDISLEYGMLSLDENFYNGRCDYELEFEINDLAGGRKQFNEILDHAHLTYKHNCESKLKRAIDSL